MPACLLLLLIAIALPWQDARAEVSMAEFCWSEEFEGGSRIVHSTYRAGAWGGKRTVHSDGDLNILPSIAAAPNGDLVVVWTAFDRNRFSLKYSLGYGTGPELNWSAARVLTDKLSTNLAPLVIHDRSSTFWVFWTANDGDDDDVYQSRLGAGGWSPPVRVHAQNKTPDILPLAGLSESGAMWLRWDRLQGNLIGRESTVFVISPDDAVTPNFGEEQIEELRQRQLAVLRLDPPPAFRSRSRASMYLAEDPLLPARLFDGNLLQ